MSKQIVSTQQAAAMLLVKPNTLRSGYCRDGHYLKIKPIKLENGRLGWPLDKVEEKISGGGKWGCGQNLGLFSR